MTIPTATQILTIQDYLVHHDDTNFRDELVKGQLLKMPPPRPHHQFIVRFLTLTLEQEIRRLALPWMTLTHVGVKTRLNSIRCPDLYITTIQQAKEVNETSGIFETPILLAIEVVSPSSVEDDYSHKRDEYQALGITEYWIVDAIRDQPQITVHTLKNQTYESHVFAPEQRLISQIFPDLNVMTQAILNP